MLENYNRMNTINRTIDIKMFNGLIRFGQNTRRNSLFYSTLSSYRVVNQTYNRLNLFRYRCWISITEQ